MRVSYDPSSHLSRRLYACLLGSVLLAAGVLLSPRPASGQTTIYVDDDASGDTNGSQSDPYAALQEAFSEASNTSGAVEVRVADGVYYPDEGSGVTDGDSSATFRLSGDLTVKGGYTSDFSGRDPAANVTVLSGDIDQDDTTNENGVVTDTADVSGMNSTHVLRAQQINGTATLDGLTITAGQANKSQSDTGLREGLNGGGLISRSSDVVLNNVTVRGNYTAGAPGGGGGLFSNEAGDSNAEPGSLAVKNSTLRGNAGRQGGAVRVQDGPLVLRNTTVRNNRARTDGGGVVSSGRTELADVTFRNNATVSGSGGGFYLSSFVEVTVRFQTVTFEANTAGGAGGGAYMEATPGPQLIDVTFQDNSVEEANAGGLYVNTFGGGGGLLRNAMFENNTAEASGGFGGGSAEGGAMVCLCTLTITNTTFRGNSSGTNGGAVLAAGGVTFDGVLFENNSTGEDGGALDIARSGSSGWILRDVVFEGNASDGEGSGDTNGGGALAASASSFAPSGVDGRLRNVRFVNNESGEDGGAMMITRGGDYELQNVDFIDNVTGGDFGGEGAALVTEDATATLVNGEVRGNNGPGGESSKQRETHQTRERTGSQTSCSPTTAPRRPGPASSATTAGLLCSTTW